MGENEKVQCMSAQAELSDEIQWEETEPEDILQKVDLSGIDDWDPKMQQEARDLIHETSIVKHSIKLTDSSPFKECY